MVRMLCRSADDPPRTKNPPVSFEILVRTATSMPPKPTEKTGTPADLAALMAASIVTPLTVFSPSVIRTIAFRPDRAAMALAAVWMAAYKAVLPPRGIASIAAFTAALSVVKFCARTTVLPNDQTAMLSLGPRESTSCLAAVFSLLKSAVLSEPLTSMTMPMEPGVPDPPEVLHITSICRACPFSVSVKLPPPSPVTDLPDCRSPETSSFFCAGRNCCLPD